MEVIDLISKRFSPREFSAKSITEEQLLVLLEAAGKAPSAYHEQPWRFIYALKDDSEDFQRLLSCLLPGNQEWARHAAALIITVVKQHHDRNNKVNVTAKHDLGLAVGNISVQAMSMDIYMHQMGGIDLDSIPERLHLPEGYEPVTAIALGYFEGDMPEKTRLSLNDYAMKGGWKH
ncbi:MAG: nitroreductase family protein [Flavobacteriales bacterium]|nr:nitroreductase family protein [Flavobacteriales bacterium]